MGVESRRWGPVLAVVLTVLTVLVVATSLVRINPPTRAERPDEPDLSGEQSLNVTTYLVTDTSLGPRLVSELVSVVPPAPGKWSGKVPAPLVAALTAAVKGTSSDPDYRSAFPEGTTVEVSLTADERLLVDLGGVDATVSYGPDDALAMDAIARTAAANRNVADGLIVAVDGRPLKKLWGHPVADVPGPDAEVLAPVQLARPAQGDKVGTTFAITGTALTPDGLVTWALLREETVVQHGTTSAEPGTRSPFSIQVKAPPGTYVVQVSVNPGPEANTNLPDRDNKFIEVR